MFKIYSYSEYIANEAFLRCCVKGCDICTKEKCFMFKKVLTEDKKQYLLERNKCEKDKKNYLYI